MDIGSYLKAERLKLELGQEKFAARVGVSGKTIADIESGRTTPSRATLRKLANTLECSIDMLDSMIDGESSAA